MIQHKVGNYVVRIISIIIACLGTQLVFAQNIVVQVKQKGSGIAVEAATVVLDAGKHYDETGHNGRITFLDVDKPHEIKVLAPGYDTLVSRDIPDKDVITLYLIPLVMTGEGLEVTAERLIEKASKISLSTTELLKAAGSGGDPLKALTALPGMVSAEEGGAEVYMRGSNGNENISWINNAPVGYLYHFGGFQSVINPSLIKDINVFLGGFPVEYGDALGGVIDAQLRVPQSDRMHYKADISFLTTSLLAEGPIAGPGGDSFFIAGRRSYIDLILSPEDFEEEEENVNDPDKVLLVPIFYDFQTLYHHKLARGSLDSYIFSAGDQFEFEPVASARSDPQFAGEFRNKIEFQTMGSTWKQRWDSQLDSIATAAVYHTKTTFKVGTDDSGNSFFSNMEESIFYLQPEIRWRPRDGTQINVGLTGRYGRLPIDLYLSRLPRLDDAGDFILTDQKKYRVKQVLDISELSPYVKYRYRLSPLLVGQFGLRHTNIAISSGYSTHKFSPRLALEYQFNGSTLLTANWGKYIQSPGTDEVVNGYSNPGLLVTEAEHRILGIEYNINTFFSVKAEVYHKPMHDLVVTIDQNTAPDNYANEGTGEAYGFDLFIKRIQSQGTFGWLSLSVAKSTRTNNISVVTRDFSGDQALTLTGVWGQAFSSPTWKRWDWGFKVQVHSGKPYTAVNGRHRDATDTRWVAEYGEQNGERYPTFFKLDIRIGREVLYRESILKFYFDIQNATFSNNIVEYDYGYDYEKFGNPTEISEGGFFPYFGVEMEF